MYFARQNKIMQYISQSYFGDFYRTDKITHSTIAIDDMFILQPQ